MKLSGQLIALSKLGGLAPADAFSSVSKLVVLEEQLVVHSLLILDQQGKGIYTA